jgi:glycogen debranching enzyme
MAMETLASGDAELRIAELYCGFPDEGDGLGPVNYPVSCIPQAWAAGAGLLALTTLLGIDIDTATGELTASPHLPDGWTWLHVDGLRTGDLARDIRIRLSNDMLAVDISAKPGS